MKHFARLALGCLLVSAAAAAPSVVPFNTVVTTVTWDDNLSNADTEADRVSDVLVGARFALDQAKPVNGSDRLRLQVHLDLQEA
jgi:carbohydrate-selective porin OprB